MSIATTIILGALGSILAATVIWVGGRLVKATVGASREDRPRASAFSKALTKAADEALVDLEACIGHRDPVWYGPENNWQTADSMSRMGALKAIVDQLEALIPEAAARLPLGITKQVKQLRDLCRNAWLDTSDPAVLERAEQMRKAINRAAGSPLGRADSRRAQRRKRLSDEYDLLVALRS